MTGLPWARSALRIMDRHLRAPGEDPAVLLAENVPAHTIDALYPFDHGDYADGIARLCALRAQQKRLRTILKPIDVPYELAVHLPKRPDKELWRYMQQQHQLAPNVAQRVGAVSQSLLLVALAADLVGEAETMLLLPHLLYLLRDYPFAEQEWSADAKQVFDDSLAEIKPNIVAYAELIEKHAAEIWALGA